MIFRNQKIYKIDDRYIAIKYHMYRGNNKIYVVLTDNKIFAEHMHGSYSYETATSCEMYLYKLNIEKFYETGKELKLKDLLILNVIINDYVKSLSIYFGL